MESWRPNGWENAYQRKDGVVEQDWLLCYRAFEQGANALWEALFKLAEESPTKTFTIDSRVINIYKEGKDATASGH